jgi:hypothetical protein
MSVPTVALAESVERSLGGLRIRARNRCNRKVGRASGKKREKGNKVWLKKKS